MKHIFKVLAVIATMLIFIVNTAPNTFAQKQNMIRSAPLPKQVDNSLTDHFPQIGYQFVSDSPASWAVTYYLATYQIAKARGWDARVDTSRQMSPQFTFALSHETDDPTASLEKNLNVLLEHGCLPLNRLPFIPYDADMKWPTKKQWRDALANKITGYGHIDAVNTPAGLNALKAMLSEGNILAFATYFGSWDYTEGERIYVQNNTESDTASYSGQLIVTKMDGSICGRALTIVGYNDDIWVDIDHDNHMDENELGALKVALSRGTSFANQGFIWIAYDALRDAEGHPCILCGGKAYWVQAGTSDYQPKVTAEIPVDTDNRNQMILFAGVNWSEASEPCAIACDHIPSPNDYLALYYHDSTLCKNRASKGYHDTIILDMTDFAQKCGFYDPVKSEFKSGRLTFSVGVWDSPGNGDIKVGPVNFKNEITGQSFPAETEDVTTVNNSLKWFSGRSNISGSPAPATEPAVGNLPAIPMNKTQYVSLDGTQNEKRWQFCPDEDGTYIFAPATNDVRIEILNDAGHRLYMENSFQGGAAIQAALQAGKTYVLMISGNGKPLHTTASLTSSSEMLSTDSGLKDIHINNFDLNPGFSPEIKEYKISLPSDKGEAKIHAEANAESATVWIGETPATDLNLNIPADGDEHRTDIHVVARNGSEGRTYSIIFTRPAPLTLTDPNAPTNPASPAIPDIPSIPSLSNIATLTDIKISQGSINKAFTPKQMSYTLHLNEYQDNVVITPIRSDSRSTLYIDGKILDSKQIILASGKTIAVRIKVVSQTGKASKSYQIMVMRDKSSNNKLASLDISAGTLSQTFSPDVQTYEIKLDEQTAQTTINVTRDNGAAKASPSSRMIKLETGASKKVIFKVKAQSGDTRTYTIFVVREKSTDDSLSILHANIPSLNPAFSPDNTIYTLNLSKNESSVVLKANKLNKYATVMIGNILKTSQRFKVLNGQTMDVAITVIAQAGNRRTYTVRVTKP